MKEKINIKECANDFFGSTEVILNATSKIVDEVTNGEKDNPTDENLRIAGDFYGHLADFVYYMKLRRDELKKFCEKYHDEVRRVHLERLDSLNTD